MKTTPTDYQAPPCSPETELAVLSTAVCYPEGYHRAAEVIGTSPVFYETEHGELWQAIVDCYRETPDTRPDYCQLISHGAPPPLVGKAAGIISLPTNAAMHARELVRLYKLRRGRDLSATLVRATDEQDSETAEAVAQDMAALFSDTDADVLPVARIYDAPEPTAPLFRHGLPQGTLGAVCGVDGGGKSYLMLDLLLSCCTGRVVNVPAIARVNGPINCMYLSYEDSPSNIRFRVNKILDSAGMLRDTLQELEESGRLRIVTDAAPLFTQEGRGMPEPTETFRALSARLKKGSVDLLIIDPLRAACLLQSENDNSAVNFVACKLRALAAQTNTAVLLTHHISKMAGRQGRAVVQDHQIAVGASALISACRWAMNITLDTDSKDVVEIGVSKNSYGPKLFGVVLQRDPETGALRQLEQDELDETRRQLAAAVTEFVRDNPNLSINPVAVRRRSSEPAKRLIDTVDARPCEVHDAIMFAIKRGQLATEKRLKANHTGHIDVLVLPENTEKYSEDEIPF